MHDILRERVWRRLEALPQEQLYQALDYIEFLEAKYAREQARRPDALQKFAERVEDGLRFRSVAPKVITGTVGLLGTARRVMKTVSDAGLGILGEAPAGSKPPAPLPRSPAPEAQRTVRPTNGSGPDTTEGSTQE
ncbi:MAG TPA: hypothetical protein VK928_02010 [Longimicrobiales bacterium]|nr:hypothetical protein [Longimicrobiales bacterium]